MHLFLILFISLTRLSTCTDAEDLGYVPDATSDALRAALMRGQLGESADRGLGLMMEALFLRAVDAMPRMSFLSVTQMAYSLNMNAPKTLNLDSINYQGIINLTTNFVLPDFSDPLGAAQEIAGTLVKNDDIPNYIQGILFTMVAALLGIALTLFCRFCLLCGCLHCCCCLCCCKCLPCCKREIQEKDPMKYRAVYRRRKCCQWCLRCGLCIGGFLTLAVFGVIGLFEYQSHIGISNSYDSLDTDYGTIVDFVGEVFKIPENIEEILVVVEEKYNETVDEVIKVLPLGDALEPHIQCVENIIDSLPDLARILDFVDGVNASLSDLPSFEMFDELSANVSVWLDKMQYEDLVDLETQLSAIIDSIDAVPVKLTQLQNAIGAIDAMRDLFPSEDDINSIADALDEIEDIRTNVFSESYVNTFVHQLENIGDYEAQEIAPNVRTFLATVDRFAAVDFGVVNLTLFQFQEAKDNAPDGKEILDLVEELGGMMSSIDVGAMMGSVDAMNVSVSGLIDVVRSIGPMLSSLNETVLAFIPDFSPLFEELGKIETTIEIAACINNITLLVEEINSTLVILPSDMSDMISRLANMTSFLEGEVNFEEVLGSVSDMSDSVGGQLQDVIIQIQNMSIDSMLSDLPNLGDIGSDFDTATGDLSSGSDSFNTTEFAATMSAMNESVNGVPDMAQYMSLIGGVENVTARAAANNETFYMIADGLELAGATHLVICPIPGECSNLADTLITLKNATSDVPVDVIRDCIDTFNGTITGLPSVSEYGDRIGELNDTLSTLPDLSGILDTIRAANDTLAQDLPFSDFSSNIDQFSGALDGFDLSAITGSLESVEPMYEMINQSNLFDQFNLINEMMDPMLAQPLSLIAQVGEALGGVNSTLSEVKGFFDQGMEYKVQFIDGYIKKYDGYRLLGALLLVLFFLPIPSFFAFGCCCYRRPGCCLLGLGLIFADVALILWLFPLVGVPIGIALEEGCTEVETYVGQGIDAMADVAELLDFSTILPESNLTKNLNISRLLREGISADFASDFINGQLEQLGDVMPENMTLDISFDFDFPTINLKQLLLNYISISDPCANPDALVILRSILNSSIHSVLDGIGDSLLDLDLMGFQIHPQFPVTLKRIFLPTLLNFTDFLTYAEPLVGCENVNAMYSIGYRLICDRFRYSFMFVWGLMAVIALFLTFIAALSCVCYCCLTCGCAYTSPGDDKRQGMPQTSRKTIMVAGGVRLHGMTNVQ